MGAFDKYRVNPDGTVGVQASTSPTATTPTPQYEYSKPTGTTVSDGYQIERVQTTEADNNLDPLWVSDAGAITQEAYDKIPLEEYQSNRAYALTAAFKSENLIGVASNWIGDKYDVLTSEADPNFDLRDHMEAYKNVDPQFWDEVNAAQNKQHFDMLINKYGKLTKDINYLDDLGAEGVGYRMVALLADVPFISAIQKLNAVGKLGTTLQKLDKSYAGRALFAGAVEGSFEGVKQLAAPQDRTELDLLMAVGLGGVMGGLYKPAVYAGEMEDVIRNTVREQVQEVAATGKLTIPERIRATVESLQVDVGSVFKNSPSPTMNSIGDLAFHDVLNPTTTFKATESQVSVIDGLKSAFNQNFNPVMLDYMETLYGKGVLTSRFAMEKQDEFFNVIGRLYYGDDALREALPPELVTKLDNAIAKMSRDSHDIMSRNNHPLFVDGSIPRMDDWMPRRWNKNKIREDIASGALQKSDLEKAVLNGFKAKFDDLGLTVDEARLEEASKNFVHTLTKQQIRVGDKGYIMEDNALKTVMEELTQRMGLSLDEAEAIQDAVLRRTKGAQKGTAASTKHRADLDMEATYVNEFGQEIRLKDYVQTNAQTLWLDYGRSMGGDTALRQMGINSRADLQQLRDQVAKELSSPTGEILQENQKYMNNFDAVVADMLGMNSKADPASAFWKTTRIANNMTRAAKLGATWFALSAETAQVAHRVGVVNMMKSLPSLRQITKKLRGKDAGKVYDEIQTYEALGHEIHDMPSSARWDDTYLGHSGSSKLDKLERLSDQAAEAAYLAGGVKSGTAMLEHMFSVGNRLKMVSIAQKQRLTSKDYWYFEQFGFDKDTTKRIVANIRKFGDDKNKALLNLDQWEDGLGHQWSLGVRRQSHILIQRGDIGEQVGLGSSQGALLKDNMLGSLAMNLRNYMLLAWKKQFSRGVVNMTRGGRDTWDAFSNWTTVTAGAFLGYTAKQYATYWNDNKKLKEAMSPERIAAGTFSMTTYSSMLPTALDIGTAGIGESNMFSGGARGNEINILGATGNYLFKDLPNAAATAKGLVSPYNDVSKYEIERTFGVLPLSTNIFIKQATSEMAEMLKEK